MVDIILRWFSRCFIFLIEVKNPDHFVLHMAQFETPFLVTLFFFYLTLFGTACMYSHQSLNIRVSIYIFWQRNPKSIRWAPDCAAKEAGSNPGVGHSTICKICKHFYDLNFFHFRFEIFQMSIRLITSLLTS